MTILEEIACFAAERAREAKKKIPLQETRSKAEAMPARGAEFEAALGRNELSFICECKKASPSKGVIAPDYDPLAIALEYEAAGADCLSVLTEPKWFLGSGDHLKQIAAAVRTPVLRKDFAIDEYMIYEAKALGAAAVLLICSILNEGARLADFLALSRSIGLAALVEAHDEAEIEAALKAGANVIGVNNRNLADFSVDTNNAARLRRLVPEGVLFVSESGVKSPQDVAFIKKTGADAALIGEALMRSKDKKALLEEFRLAAGEVDGTLQAALGE